MALCLGHWTHHNVDMGSNLPYFFPLSVESRNWAHHKIRQFRLVPGPGRIDSLRKVSLGSGICLPVNLLEPSHFI